jgi:hypothetical protein
VGKHLQFVVRRHIGTHLRIEIRAEKDIGGLQKIEEKDREITGERNAS